VATAGQIERPLTGRRALGVLIRELIPVRLTGSGDGSAHDEQ
jgi:hypothetical protein